ncbi:MAG: efflux transporter outer membrane subunit [Burkholderiaceae bacterium]
MNGARRALVVLSAAAALVGCAAPGSLPPPAQPLAPARVGLAASTTSEAPDRWWQSWGDPTLDALVARALADAPSLQAAQARIVRAAAQAQGVAALDQPQLGLGVDVTRQRYTEHGLIPPPIAGGTYTNANAQVSLGWEFDLFGRQRAALDAALGAERAARADAQAAAAALATQVVRTAVGLARVLAQRAVQQRTVTQREEMLALTRRRVQAGLDTQVELRLAESAVPDARQQLAALDEQAVLARHALAALTVQPPEALADYAPRLPDAITLPRPEALGADLLGRRADVSAARSRVEAALADVTSARAQFLPNVSLSAFVGLSALGLDRWLDLGSRTLGAGPALRLPLFDGGRLQANLRGRAAEADAAVASYNAVVLDAVREAADALGSLRSLAQQRDLQRQAALAAEAAYDAAQQRYRAGLSGYLLVLQAESQVLAQSRLGVELHARELDTLAQLMRTLGGGVPPPNVASRGGVPPPNAASRGGVPPPDVAVSRTEATR